MKAADLTSAARQLSPTRRLTPVTAQPSSWVLGTGRWAPTALLHSCCIQGSEVGDGHPVAPALALRSGSTSSTPLQEATL